MNALLSQYVARTKGRIDRAKLEGFWHTALQAIDFTAATVVWILLLPAAYCFHVAGFRRLTVLVGRVGHLAAEPDSFLKARALGMVAPGRYFMTAPRNEVANNALLDFWRPHITTIEQPFACWLLRAMSRWLVMRHDMSRYVLKLNASQEIYRINSAWKGRPLLTLAPADIAWSDTQFLALGLPKNAWYVCVHVRESGFSPEDESAHAYRNADPEAVRTAMEEIVHRGGWCVRMGDPSMTRLRPMPGVIDYAHLPLRSDRLDVLLCARARFFLGNTSGIALVSSVFGVPSALANLVPLSVRAFLPGDIFIPKMLRYKPNGNLLPFPVVMGGAVADFRYSQLFADAGIEVIENSPEEIRQMTIELLDRSEGRFISDPRDERLQHAYHTLFRPGHYAYGASSRVGTAFLRSYAALLSSVQVE